MTNLSDYNKYYNTSDANVTPADLRMGTVAYGTDGRVGTLLNTLVIDDFTDSDATLLSAHTPDTDIEAGGWTNDAGDLSIYSNKVRTGATAACISSIDVGESDVVIEATLSKGSSASSVGLMARNNGSSSFWFLGISSFGGETGIRLWSYNGVWTNVMSNTSITVNTDTDYVIRMECVSDVIKGYIDGVQVIYYKGATLNQTRTTHGFRFNSQSTHGYADALTIKGGEA